MLYHCIYYYTTATYQQIRSTANILATSMLQALNIPADLKIAPAYVHTFETNPSLPTIIYYTRRCTTMQH
jgi:hypothetical protein